MEPQEIRDRVGRAVPAMADAPWGEPGHVAPGARVVSAMSGGVDSSVATALLRGAGYEVVGVSMRLSSSLARADGHTGCCSLDDFEDARAAARVIGVPHYVVDFREVFQERVIDVFRDTYLAGRTPNPCTLCNRDVKFDAFWDAATTMDAAAVGTGHYARIERTREGRFALRTGCDPGKDQSYFLFTLGQEELARTLFPVGHLEKSDVRAIAAALDLPVATKPESQDICFVAGRSYEDFVEEGAPSDAFLTGRIVDEGGAELGRHEGVHRFTVGQRKGLGGGSAEPRYVNRIDMETGDVHVGGRDALLRTGLKAAGVSWTDAPYRGPATVRLRHRHRPIPCRVEPSEAGVDVCFEAPEMGVTPGQAAVFYDGDRVIGGGWIEAEPAGEAG